MEFLKWEMVQYIVLVIKKPLKQRQGRFVHLSESVGFSA